VLDWKIRVLICWCREHNHQLRSGPTVLVHNKCRSQSNSIIACDQNGHLVPVVEAFGVRPTK